MNLAVYGIGLDVPMNHVDSVKKSHVSSIKVRILAHF